MQHAGTRTDWKFVWGLSFLHVEDVKLNIHFYQIIRIRCKIKVWKTKTNDVSLNFLLCYCSNNVFNMSHKTHNTLLQESFFSLCVCVVVAHNVNHTFTNLIRSEKKGAYGHTGVHGVICVKQKKKSKQMQFWYLAWLKIMNCVYYSNQCKIKLANC